MASDGQPVKISATSLVHGSQAPTTVKVQSGKNLPQSGNAAALAAAARPAGALLPGAKTGAPATSRPAVSSTDLPAQITLLNKFLNDSGRPIQFRVDPTSDNKLIQEVNPATGEVIGEYSATEFAALARSVGISGVLVNSHA
jgi:uncharacterized FlaG/YvyC family protein